MTRGQAEYLDYLRQCAAKKEEPKVFICSKCDRPLKTKNEMCPQCYVEVVDETINSFLDEINEPADSPARPPVR